MSKNSQSRTKTEINAINIVSGIVNKSDRLLPSFSVADKGISTDGYIQLFKNNNTEKSENFLHRIPVQIKGRTDNSKNQIKIHKDIVKFSVETKDLRNYNRMGGIVFFLVYFSKNDDVYTVYYSVMLPVKLTRYLNLSKQQNSNTLPVSFNRLEESGKAVFELALQFYEESKRQGLGDGQIMKHLVSLADLSGKTTINVDAVGVSNEFELFRKITRGDVHPYIKQHGFELPVEWVEDSYFVERRKREGAVAIDGVEYFDSYDLEIRTSDDKVVIYLGECVVIDMRNNKLFFSIKGHTINDIAAGARFVLALNRSGVFKTGEHQVELEGFRIDNTTIDRMKFYDRLDSVIESIGMDVDIPIETISKKMWSQLVLLYEITEGRKNDCFKEKVTLYDWKIEGKSYPLVVIKKRDGRCSIYSFLYTSPYQTYCGNDQTGHYVVPIFAFISSTDMQFLYTYQIAPFEEQFKRMDVNEVTADYINIGALNLISAYDGSGKKQFLTLARKMLKSIQHVFVQPVFITLNLMQIKKRIGRLSEKDINELRLLANVEDSVVRFGAYVLLEDKRKAKEAFERIPSNVASEIENMPIMKFYREIA